MIRAMAFAIAVGRYCSQYSAGRLKNSSNATALGGLAHLPRASKDLSRLPQARLQEVAHWANNHRVDELLNMLSIFTQDIEKGNAMAATGPTRVPLVGSWTASS